jgi:katanin p80 WD40 repeat-containing subunit B1
MIFFYIVFTLEVTHSSYNVNLQVVRHFWERNDSKGAISALRKLPDHSVGIYWKSSSVMLNFFSCFKLVSSAFFCIFGCLNDHLILVQVQADVISVLMEKTEILTLDLFSCMLPVLLGLLDSKVER